MRTQETLDPANKKRDTIKDHAHHFSSLLSLFCSGIVA